jgi:L-fucose mutarotase
MDTTPGDTVETPIWDIYEATCKHGDPAFGGFTRLERFAFYERSKKAYAIVATGEAALYANIILKKGVVV